MRSQHSTTRRWFVVLAIAIVIAAAGATSAQSHTSRPFSGQTVNGGTVTHNKDGRVHKLTLSDDFKVPGSPDPHWQVVDSAGRVYLLQRLTIKEDKVNKTIVVPSYISDIAEVRMWCAWAEVVLGTAPFDSKLTLD